MHWHALPDGWNGSSRKRCKQFRHWRRPAAFVLPVEQSVLRSGQLEGLPIPGRLVVRYLPTAQVQE